MGRNPKLLLDPHRIPEWYRFQHSSLPVCDVDAVMERYAALIFGGFGERDAGASHSMCARSFQVRQFYTLIVEDIEVIV
jgi:hypothetical protein